MQRVWDFRDSFSKTAITVCSLVLPLSFFWSSSSHSLYFAFAIVKEDRVLGWHLLQQRKSRSTFRLFYYILIILLLLYPNKTVVIFIIPIVEIRKDQDFRDWQRWNLNPNSRTSLISPALFIKGCWNGSFSTSAFKLFTAASGLVSIFQIKLSIFSLDLDIHKRCFLWQDCTSPCSNYHLLRFQI